MRKFGSVTLLYVMLSPEETGRRGATTGRQVWTEEETVPGKLGQIPPRAEASEKYFVHNYPWVIGVLVKAQFAVKLKSLYDWFL